MSQARAKPSRSNGTLLERELLERLRRARAPDGVRGTIALDVTGGETWTFRVGPDGVSLAAGEPDDVDTTISADASTLTAVLDGSLSGIQAFVDGRLRVRGNLALSLRLGTFLDNRPRSWHRAQDVLIDGIRTFYLDAGKGPAVILLHGLGATNASMLPTFWDLGRDHRVIAPDIPGFGESGKPLRSYNAAFFGQWLVGFLDKLGIDRAHLVGNSMGGRIAIEGGLVAPDRVDRIALLSPSPAFIKYRGFARFVRVLRPELALVPVPMPRSIVMRELRRLFARPERLPDEWYEAAADEFLRVFARPGGRIAFFSAARQIYLEEPYGDDGFWDRLCDLERPSLFVWGAKDRLVPAAFARHVEKALPVAKSVVLEDCGHVPQYELPERTHQLVRGFLHERD